MGHKPKMFAKTGVAIVENTATMNTDHVEKIWINLTNKIIKSMMKSLTTNGKINKILILIYISK